MRFHPISSFLVPKFKVVGPGRHRLPPHGINTNTDLRIRSFLGDAGPELI